MTVKKKKVLISAYACHPPTTGGFDGEENILGAGESILGWNLVQQVSRWHDVWVITQRRNRRGIERAIRQGEMPGVKFYYLDFPLWPRTLWQNQITLHLYYYFWQVRACLLAAELQRQIHFDFSHHVTFANYWMPSFIGAFLPIPFIWGPVGGGQETPQSFSKEYPWSGRIAEVQRYVSQWMGRNLLFSRRRCLKRARAILVCNQDTKGKMPEKYYEKIHFFPVNGISAEDIKLNGTHRGPSESFQVLTTGRLVYWKNFASSIRAFCLFADKFPNSKFSIIGEGAEAVRLKKLISDLKLQDKVQLIHWLPQKELLTRIRLSDVFLYPSLREGGGAVVVEAMACGIPVVCLNSAGPGFHIQEGWGIKIEPQSPEFVTEQMAKALAALYLNPEWRASMGRAAQRRAQEFYVWDRLGERLQEIYRAALD